MTKVCLWTGVVSDQFEAGFPIDHEHQFAAKRHERDIRVRTEAAFAGDTDTGQRGVFEAGGDLGSGRIELGSCPLNLAAECPELIGVDPHGQSDNQSQLVSQNRPNDTFLCVHGYEDGDGVLVGTILRRRHQK